MSKSWLSCILVKDFLVRLALLGCPLGLDLHMRHKAKGVL